MVFAVVLLASSRRCGLYDFAQSSNKVHIACLIPTRHERCVSRQTEADVPLLHWWCPCAQLDWRRTSLRRVEGCWLHSFSKGITSPRFSAPALSVAKQLVLTAVRHPPGPQQAPEREEQPGSNTPASPVHGPKCKAVVCITISYSSFKHCKARLSRVHSLL